MQSRVFSSESRLRPWLAALLYALPVAAGILVSMYYWFAVADRHTVFLYYHDMGVYYPDTSPFSRVTTSRYWMTGLVAGGAVMLCATSLSWLLGRLRRYRSPSWWRVWVIAAPLSAIGIPWITMTVNWPTLPLGLALQVTAVALAGLALALLPAQLAAERPLYLTGLALDGGALSLWLLFAINVELLPRWIASGKDLWIRMLIVGSVAGVLGLLILTGLRIWRRLPRPTMLEVMAAGFCVAYLLLPLAHYVIGTDGYFYLTNSDNFFAQGWLTQLVVWSVAGLLIFGTGRLGRARSIQA